MLCRYLGKASFTGYGEGLIFIHEKLNEVEMKVYFDLLYQAGAKNVVYADESVKGIPEGTPWEDVIWGMKNTYKNLRFAVEITKEQPMDIRWRSWQRTVSGGDWKRKCQNCIFKEIG